MPERIRVQQTGGPLDIMFEVPVVLEDSTELVVHMFWMQSQLDYWHSSYYEGQNLVRLQGSAFRDRLHAFEFGSTSLQGRSWRVPKRNDAGGTPALVVALTFHCSDTYCPLIVAVGDAGRVDRTMLPGADSASTTRFLIQR
jgi:hypothetical protein